MKKSKLIALLLAFVMLLASCTASGEPDSSETQKKDTPPSIESTSETESAGEKEAESDAPVIVPEVVPDSDIFTSRDTETDYDPSKCAVITLSDTGAASSSKAVNISGSTVMITDEGDYIIRGSFDGMIVVNAGSTDKVRLIFEGVTVHSESSAALYILDADKVFITLADGTENSLSSGDEFVAIDESNIDAALFSKQDLTINGSGTLTITSPAGHGIVCKDDLVLTGGNITVNSASHGIDANDSVRVNGTLLTVDSGKDGIHVENSDNLELGFFYIANGSIAIDTEGDGISASTCATIRGGSINITAGGGHENGEIKSSSGWGGFMGGRPGRKNEQNSSAEADSTGSSMKGIKTGDSLEISGGFIKINSADDALHSSVSLSISGGEFELATGDDALHADEDLAVSGGKINISTSYEGLEGLHITVSGGEINLTATDDGINVAGGTDSSGTTGGRDGMFNGGGRPGGGPGGGHGFGSSNGSVTISGGQLYINSSGDGIDANGTLEITGGYTVIVGPTQGDTATLDYDTSAVISGGTFIGTGASGMAQTFSDSENQGVIAVSVGNQQSGTTITLTDTSGNTILTHTPELSFGVVILSSPDIKKGESYTIKVGEASGSFTAN